MPLFSPQKCESRMDKLFDLQETKYRVCPNGCRLFPQGSTDPCLCEAVQFRPNGTPIKTMPYFPLAKQLSAFVADDNTRDLLLQTGQQTEEGIMTDIFDGSVYQACKQELFPTDMDIALSLFIDGFSAFKGSNNSKMTILHVVILSLPPLER